MIDDIILSFTDETPMLRNIKIFAKDQRVAQSVFAT
jgi:hypothetical protein